MTERGTCLQAKLQLVVIGWSGGITANGGISVNGDNRGRDFDSDCYSGCSSRQKKSKARPAKIYHKLNNLRLSK